MKENEFVGEDGNIYEVRAIMVYSPNCFCRHLVPSDPDFLTAAETAESWMISIPAYLPDINPWNGRVLAIAWALGECQENLKNVKNDVIGLVERILSLIPKHPEIMKMDSSWYLEKVEGFNCDDLRPSTFLVDWAMRRAQQIYLEQNNVSQ